MYHNKVKKKNQLNTILAKQNAVIVKNQIEHIIKA